MWDQVDGLHQNNETSFERKIIKCLVDLKEQYLVWALCLRTAELSISCRTACVLQTEVSLPLHSPCTPPANTAVINILLNQVK